MHNKIWLILVSLFTLKNIYAMPHADPKLPEQELRTYAEAVLSRDTPNFDAFVPTSEKHLISALCQYDSMHDLLSKVLEHDVPLDTYRTKCCSYNVLHICAQNNQSTANAELILQSIRKSGKSPHNLFQQTAQLFYIGANNERVNYSTLGFKNETPLDIALRQQKIDHCRLYCHYGAKQAHLHSLLFWNNGTDIEIRKILGVLYSYDYYTKENLDQFDKCLDFVEKCYGMKDQNKFKTLHHMILTFKFGVIKSELFKNLRPEKKSYFKMLPFDLIVPLQNFLCEEFTGLDENSIQLRVQQEKTPNHCLIS